jgi:hypothetical protein
MDLQDDHRSELQYGEITEKIIGVHSKSSMNYLKATGIDQGIEIIRCILSIDVHSLCPKNYAPVLMWKSSHRRNKSREHYA